MSFPKYAKYKDSEVAWLGEVPAHWAVLPIKRCLRSIEQGWSPQCEGFPAEPGQWGVLKVGCVNGSRFNADENKALPASLDPIPALAIRRGDVLVSRANTRELVGSVAVAHVDHDKLLLCDKLYRLRTDEDRCVPEFLALYLTASAVRSVIEAAATGASSSMLNIGQAAIIGMQIALPPHAEQLAMLAFLGGETAKIDSLVEEQRRLIELLKEKRQAVISQAVTKGLNPDTPTKVSGVDWLGKVPQAWTVRSLRTLSSVVRGASPRPAGDPKFFDGDHIPWVTVAEITKDALTDLTETDTCLTEAGAEHSRLFRSGTVIYSNSGATLGVPKILRVDACANDGVVGFESLSDLVEPIFLYHYLSSLTTTIRDMGRVMAGVMHQVSGRADGSTVSQLVKEKLA